MTQDLNKAKYQRDYYFRNKAKIVAKRNLTRQEKRACKLTEQCHCLSCGKTLQDVGRGKIKLYCGNRCAARFCRLKKAKKIKELTEREAKLLRILQNVVALVSSCHDCIALSSDSDDENLKVELKELGLEI